MGRSPATMSVDQGREWVRTQAAWLAALPAVAAASLCPLGSASAGWGCEFDWLLELHLRDGAPVGDVVEQTAWNELLGDLRLLGMRPQVAVADAGREGDLTAR